MSISQTTFGNASCGSTNYLWFVLEYINKMHWDCCLFFDEPKSEELRGKVKVSSKEKTVKEKKKIEENYKKIASLIHQLGDLFSVVKFSCDIMSRQFSKYSKWAIQLTITVASQTISRKRDDDKNKEAKVNKRSKRSGIEETPPIFLGEYKCLFCGVADDVSNLCAGGTQHAKSKKIKKEKNWAFNDNLWQQPSKFQDSCVLSFLFLGSAAAREMNYHRVCLTDFHNRYQALVTANAKSNCLTQRQKVDLKPLSYCNNGVEICTIGK